MNSILMFVSEEVLNDPPVLAEAMKAKFAEGYTVVAVQLMPTQGARWHEDDARIPLGGHPSGPALEEL